MDCIYLLLYYFIHLFSYNQLPVFESSSVLNICTHISCHPNIFSSSVQLTRTDRAQLVKDTSVFYTHFNEGIGGDWEIIYPEIFCFMTMHKNK